MLNRVRKTIELHRLLEQGDKILVALSGGADSVCLLDVLLCLQNEYGVSVAAAHVNHGLRGEAADADERFVQELCQTNGIPCFCKQADVKRYAEEAGVSVETAGRRVRYQFFEELCKEKGYTKVATAHHANDNAETVLMHFLRGASVDGMAGIPYQNERVIRPLLDASREDIESYLQEHNLSFCTDATNFSNDYMRNRIRNELIPYIEKLFNPAFLKTVSQNAKSFKECRSYLEVETQKLFIKFAKPIFGGYVFPARPLQDMQAYMAKRLMRYALRELLAEQEISAQTTEAMYAVLQGAGGPLCVAQDVTIDRYNGFLYIRHDKEVEAFVYEMTPGSSVTIEETGLVINSFWVQSVPQGHDPKRIYIDSQKVSGKTIQIRSRRAGDVFYPVGMQGKKSVKEYYIDQKIPHFLRSGVPLVCAEDEVIWVGGFRADSRFVVHEHTEQILCIELVEGEQTNDN